MRTYLIITLLIIIGITSGCDIRSYNQHIKLSEEYLLTKNGKSFPVWFEKDISGNFKRLILDDVNIIFQCVKDLEIIHSRKEYKTARGIEVHETRYVEFTGKPLYPRKYRDKNGLDLFGKVVNKDGQNYILISEKLIEHYVKIYKKRRYYKKIQKEAEQFISFFNNIRNLEISEIPDFQELICEIGFSEGYKYDKINIIRKSNWSIK